MNPAPAILALAVVSGPVFAQSSDREEVIRQLLKRVEQLERQVQDLQKLSPAAAPEVQALERKVAALEKEQQAAEGQARTAPRLSLGESGLAFRSADTNFLIQIKAFLQVDSRTFFNDAGQAGNDSILLRRARPILQGTLYRDFDFAFMPEFGGSGAPSILDAYVNYKYRPWLQLQAGKFKVPVGLEWLQNDRDTLFSERGLPTALVPGRDLGFKLHGDLAGERLNYQVGVFNEVGDGRTSNNTDFDDDKAVAARLYVKPFRHGSLAALQGFGLGLGGSYARVQGTNSAALPSTIGGLLPGYYTAGQQQFFAYNPAAGQVAPDGDHWRLSPQAGYFYGPFGLLAEYVVSDQRVRRIGGGPAAAGHLANTAWQVAAGYVLTGEDFTYDGIIPRRNFNPADGGWGAWQIVARYGQLDIDHAAFPLFANPASSARSAAEWSVGLNWYLNRNLRANAGFSHTSFTGGGSGGLPAPGVVTLKGENVAITRIQVAF